MAKTRSSGGHNERRQRASKQPMNLSPSKSSSPSKSKSPVGLSKVLIEETPYSKSKGMKVVSIQEK
ncbi:hypothetical protein TorRG33x02_001150, partial [Trema orientale]